MSDILRLENVRKTYPSFTLKERRTKLNERHIKIRKC